MKVIDSLDFVIQAKIINSESQEGEAVTAGQVIELHPDYMRGEGSAIDLKTERNRRLFALRSLTAGSLLRGTAYLDVHQRWMLVDSQ